VTRTKENILAGNYSDIFSKLFSKYGIKVVVFIIVFSIIIWLSAHLTAAPGTEVSILWGFVRYTKPVDRNTVSRSETQKNKLSIIEKNKIKTELQNLIGKANQYIDNPQSKFDINTWQNDCLNLLKTYPDTTYYHKFEKTKTMIALNRTDLRVKSINDGIDILNTFLKII
jgi:spore germination protein GerM